MDYSQLGDLDDDDEDDDIPVANGRYTEGNHNYPLIDMDHNDDILLVGKVASKRCKGFQPILAVKVFENFAFQLLPTKRRMSATR